MREIKSRSDKSERLGYNFITFFLGIILSGFINMDQNIYTISYIGIIIGALFVIYNRYTDYKWRKELKRDFK